MEADRSEPVSLRIVGPPHGQVDSLRSHCAFMPTCALYFLCSLAFCGALMLLCYSSADSEADI